MSDTMPSSAAFEPGPTESPYAPPPPPVNAPVGSSERNYACVIHLSTFLAPVLGPLVMWLLQKDESKFIDHHGREALNFHITQLLISGVLFVFSVCTMGIGLVVAAPLWGALWIFDIVVTVLAAIRAHDGVRWRYPLTLRLL